MMDECGPAGCSGVQVPTKALQREIHAEVQL
jgi:hypothetical protein